MANKTSKQKTTKKKTVKEKVGKEKKKAKKNKVILVLSLSLTFVACVVVTGLVLLFNTEYKVSVLNQAGVIFDFSENTTVKYGKDFSFSFTLEDGIIEYPALSKIVVNGETLLPNDNTYQIKDVKQDVTIEVFGYGTSGIGIMNKTLISAPNQSVIVIPNGITTISNSSFKNKTSLTKVSISSSVTQIKTSAFEGCSMLEQIEIGEQTTEIYANAFAGTKWLNNQSNGVIYLGSTAYGYKGTMSAGHKIVFEEKTKSIAEKAFEAQTNLIDIKMPKNFEIIMPSAFIGCSSLQNIQLSDNIKKIGMNAFTSTAWYNNTSSGFLYLNNWMICYKGIPFTGTSVIVKDNTIGIAGGTFNQTEFLTSVQLPNTLKYISDHAFINCYRLEEIILPESLETIGEYSFNNCKLTSLIIPNNVKSIGQFAFDGCYYIQTVTIKCSLESLDNTFSNCFQIKHIIMEQEIKSISSNLISLSGTIESLTLHFSNPPKVNGQDFLAFVRSNFKIFVPADALQAYKAAEAWNAKADYIFAIPEENSLPN